MVDTELNVLKKNIIPIIIVFLFLVISFIPKNVFALTYFPMVGMDVIVNGNVVDTFKTTSGQLHTQTVNDPLYWYGLNPAYGYRPRGQIRFAYWNYTFQLKKDYSYVFTFHIGDNGNLSDLSLENFVIQNGSQLWYLDNVTCTYFLGGTGTTTVPYDGSIKCIVKPQNDYSNAVMNRVTFNATLINSLPGTGIIHTSFINNVFDIEEYADYTGAINNINSTLQNLQNSISNNTNQIILNNNQNTQNIVNSNNQLNDSITSEVEADSTILDNILGPSTPSTLTDLFLLPITFLNGVLDSVDSSCFSYNLGSLFGHDLILPCIDLPHYLGQNLWGLIDVCFSVFMLYNISMLFIEVYDNFTSMSDRMKIYRRTDL